MTVKEEFMGENKWFRAENIKLIEDEIIWPILLDKLRNSNQERDLKKSNNEWMFRIVAYPESGPLRFYLEGGTTVFVYIKGLSFFGGEGVITSKSFWTQLTGVLHTVPKLYRHSELERVPGTVKVTRGRLDKSEESPFPLLIPVKNVKILRITAEIEAEDSQTGAKVVFHRPLSFIPNGDIEKDARIKLSMIVNEWDHTLLSEE